MGTFDPVSLPSSSTAAPDIVTDPVEWRDGYKRDSPPGRLASRNARNGDKEIKLDEVIARVVLDEKQMKLLGTLKAQHLVDPEDAMPEGGLVVGPKMDLPQGIKLVERGNADTGLTIGLFAVLGFLMVFSTLVVGGVVWVWGVRWRRARHVEKY